ncbi:MAG: T9SS type A sorting domain-containing protein [Ignavibacteriaceae bacterium]
MKKIIAIIIFANIIVFAQKSNSYSFFPSAVGNIWEYYDVLFGLTKYKIVKDSILPDGSKFIYFNSESSASYRIDTAYNVYKDPQGSNWLYYKLNADSGDTWIVDSIDAVYGWKAIVKRKFPSVVFGRPAIIMQIYYNDMPYDTVIYLEGWSEYIATGFGEIEYYDESGMGPQKILLGCIIEGDTLGTLTSVPNKKENLFTYQLYQNYPNPFNPTTKIRYTLAKPDYVKIIIYSVLGKKVKVLVDKYQSSGEHGVEFNAENLPSGVYIYSIISSHFSFHRKMLYLK